MTGWQRITWFLAAWGSILSGCQPRSNEQGNPPRPPRQAAGGDDERTQDGHHSDRRPVKQAEGRDAGGRSAVTTLQARTRKATDHDSVLSQSDAIQRALDIIRDSVDFAPTTVVWLVDISPSAMSWGSEIHSDVRRFYAEVVPTLTAEPDRLQTGVMTISRTVEFRVKRTTDPQAVVAALDAMRIESSGRETTFEALQQALDEYLPLRIRQRREVVFVIITDEAGDDWAQVDRLVEQPRKYALPIYVVGVPAPLGRMAALNPGIELSTEGTDAQAAAERTALWHPILQGPESRAGETIQLEFEEFSSSLELLDSGFGPFALEWLCRASGGSFLAVRGRSLGSGFANARRQQWPTVDAGEFDPQIMRSYAPDWVDETSYQNLLQGNAACRALHDAARLPRAAVLRDAEFRFEKRDEADLKNRLDRAQQAAAKVVPAVNELYETCVKGLVMPRS